MNWFKNPKRWWWKSSNIEEDLLKDVKSIIYSVLLGFLIALIYKLVIS